MAKVIEIQADAWEKEVLKADIPVVVDFWHHMCGWCLKLNPLYEQLPEMFGDRVKFVKLNVIESPDNQKLAIGLGVMGTPTLKLFCDRRDVGEIVGYRPLERLVKEIEELLEKKNECLEKSTPLKA